jgi:adenosine deaminase
MTDLVTRLPKAELHIHIEGSLEPELMFRVATRNGDVLPFEDVDQAKAAYRFTDLQAFLDIYYQSAAVLRTPEDFYDLMSAYLERALGRWRASCRDLLRPADAHDEGNRLRGLHAGLSRCDVRCTTETGDQCRPDPVLPSPPVR